MPHNSLFIHNTVVICCCFSPSLPDKKKGYRPEVLKQAGCNNFVTYLRKECRRAFIANEDRAKRSAERDHGAQGGAEPESRADPGAACCASCGKECGTSSRADSDSESDSDIDSDSNIDQQPLNENQGSEHDQRPANENQGNERGPGTVFMHVSKISIRHFRNH